MRIITSVVVVVVVVVEVVGSNSVCEGDYTWYGMCDACSFNSCSKQIITRPMVGEGREKANVLIASHNQDSIERVVRTMHQEGLGAEDSSIYFGQLLGMSDHLTFCLGQAGYKAYKYVPYGPVNEVMPYLIRRVQENSSLVSDTSQQRTMLRSELLRRLRSTFGAS